MDNFKIRLTLPSGKITYVNELKNKTYIALHKFVLNDDLTGFYSLLDSLIDLPEKEIFNLSILDKIYIYIALYVYCIKNQITLKPETLAEFGQDLSYNLFDSLDTLQDIKFNSIIKQFDTKQGIIEVEINLPTKFEEIDGVFTFNPLSGIKKLKINNKDYYLNSIKDYSVLDYIFTAQNYQELVEIIIKNFNYTIKLLENKIELPLLSFKTYEFIATKFFYGDLGYLISLTYTFLRHLNMQPSEYYEFTPIDSELLLLKLIKEKKEEKEEMQRQQEKSSKNGNLVL